MENKSYVPKLRFISGNEELEVEDGYESVPLFTGKTTETGILTMFGAALFIVGEMTGSGILGVPQGLTQSGYSGIAMMCLCVVVASYTGLILSRNWLHVKDQYPQCSRPYQSIGYTACGKAGEIAVQICATVTLFGGCCAYVLIAARCLSKFIISELHSTVIGYRTAVVIMALVFLLTLIFGAGKESLYVAVLATVLSAIFSVLIVIAILKTGKYADYEPYHITAKSWFLSFGKFLFAFGGHSAFPNFQKDMKNPRNFPGSVLIAYFIKLVLYIPIGVLGMVFFGSKVQCNILDNIDESQKVLYLCIILIVAVQAILSATILGNPVAHMVEGFFTISNHALSWKKALVRTLLVALAVCVCEAIPRFDLIMSLIGGTTINAAVFILPALFHIKLAKRDKWLTMKVTLDSLSIIFGVGAGVVCTYASLSHIVDEYR